MYLFCDLETWGLETNYPIVQIAAVHATEAFEPIGYFMQYICPDEGAEFHEKAIQINGLTREFLEQHGRDEAQVLFAFKQWIAHSKLIFAGYNCKFDMGHLDAGMERTGVLLSWETPAFDVYDIAFKKLSLPNYKLDTVRDHFKMSKKKAHDAMFDIMDTLRIAKKILTPKGVAHAAS